LRQFARKFVKRDVHKFLDDLRTNYRLFTPDALAEKLSRLFLLGWIGLVKLVNQYISIKKLQHNLRTTPSQAEASSSLQAVLGTQHTFQLRYS